MNFRNFVALSFCGAGLSVANLAMAQQPQQRAVQPQGQVGQRMQSQNPDQILASCVAIANQEEVTIAKFAEEKAQHKDVKEFAAMLVKDHQAFLQKLQQFAPEATRDGYLMERTSDGDRRTSSTQPNASSQDKTSAAGRKEQSGERDTTTEAGSGQRAGGAGEASTGQPLDVVQLHREVAQECIRSAKMGMSKKEGAEFDECFIGYQIAMHAGMKDKLVVFERHVSGDLKQLLAAGVETTEMHKKKAEQIMKKLASANSSDSKQGRSDDSK